MTESDAPSPGFLRPEVQEFKPYSPGLSIDEIRERYGLTRVVKLASNENPLGTSPLVKKAVEQSAPGVFRYPRSGNPRLVSALAEQLGVAPGRIVVGNGSDELIDLLIRAKARPGRDNVLAFKPCFSMYGLQAKLCGVEFRQVELAPDFSFPWESFLAAVDEHTALAFVTTPDNPSGHTPEVEELAALAKNLPASCLLVIDEAYMDFAKPEERYSLLSRLEEFPNVVILRTFSKMFGLAGLRLGYGIMAEWLADYMWRIRPPFSVNVPAEEAGIAALEDRDFFAATLETVEQGRKFLAESLAAMGCVVYPSRANFLMFSPPVRGVGGAVVRGVGGGVSAEALYEGLLARGVIVRWLKSFELYDHIRVSVGNAEENKFFIGAVREVLDHESKA
jgi:histidinol-phosphate aminotransferase